MKTIALVLGVLSASLAFAAETKVPNLYCVSQKSYQNVNQINLFLSDKGTLRIDLQFYAVSDDGADAGLFDTKVLETVTQLKFDAKTGLVSNGANKVSFELGKTALTQAQADKLLSGDASKQQDLENPSGFKIEFKKYYTGRMVAYNLDGRKGTWNRALKDAFKAGVTDYVCGRKEDMKGPTPSIFDDADNND